MPFKAKVNLPWKFSLRFRTAVPFGTLVEFSFKSSVSSLLEVGGELAIIIIIISSKWFVLIY